ncbi:IS200/IS605 family transposase [Nibrella saemangeumensis]|uniref:IS200/IS605 family transposase n=1 Tax=Nibrella saemangeumensis TaxID=1084526 RepID=A0ABP8MZ45_9BACT
MSHSKTKLWIHAVFSTKARQPQIRQTIRFQVYIILTKQLTDLGSHVAAIGGVEDYVHILFQLDPRFSVADVMKQVKGGSSHEINQRHLLSTKFAWQTGYGAFSISETNVERVIQYIRNQEEHHRTVPFAAEYERFLHHYGLNDVPEQANR